LKRRVSFQGSLDDELSLNLLIENKVAGALGLEYCIRLYPKAGKVGGAGTDLTLGNATDQVRLHILRFWLGGVVHIAADVKVVIMGLHDLGLADQTGVFW